LRYFSEVFIDLTFVFPTSKTQMKKNFLNLLFSAALILSAGSAFAQYPQFPKMLRNHQIQ